jgi:hypothetical protein
MSEFDGELEPRAITLKFSEIERNRIADLAAPNLGVPGCGPSKSFEPSIKSSRLIGSSFATTPPKLLLYPMIAEHHGQ